MQQPAIGIAVTCQSLGGHCLDQLPTEPEWQHHSRSAIDQLAEFAEIVLRMRVCRST